MLLTVPVVKEVVVVVNMADWAMPKRTSLPSMLPMDWLSPSLAKRRVALALSPEADTQADEEDDAHGDEDGAALAAVQLRGEAGLAHQFAGLDQILGAWRCAHWSWRSYGCGL